MLIRIFRNDRRLCKTVKYSSNPNCEELQVDVSLPLRKYFSCLARAIRNIVTVKEKSSNNTLQYREKNVSETFASFDSKKSLNYLFI